MRTDLSELLLAHRIGGQWCAPLSTSLRPVPAPAAWGQAQIVEAAMPDCARALGRLRADAGALMLLPDAPALVAAALAGAADDLDTARRAEGACAPLLRAGRPMAEPARAAGPILLLGARGAAPDLVGQVLAAGMQAGVPVLFKPAPGAAVSGALLLRALTRALGCEAARGLLLLQGGGRVTGAALAASGAFAHVLVVGKPGPLRPGLERAAPVADAAALSGVLARHRLAVR